MKPNIDQTDPFKPTDEQKAVNSAMNGESKTFAKLTKNISFCSNIWENSSRKPNKKRIFASVKAI